MADQTLNTDGGAGFWTRLKLSFMDKPEEMAAVLKKAFPNHKVGQIGEGPQKGEWVTSPDGKEWSLVDEQGFAAGDIADLAGPSLPILGSMAGEVVGGIGGGAAGIPTGPGALATGAKGAILGGGLGAGIGEATRQGVKNLIAPDATGIGEDIQNIGLESLYGAAGTAGGIGIAKGAKKFLAPNVPDTFGKGVSTIKKEYLESMGFKPTPADVSTKGPITVLDYALENLLGSSGQMQKAYKVNVDELIKKQARLARRVGGSRNPVKAGEELQAAAKDTFKQIFGAGGEAAAKFDNVGKLSKGVDIDLTPVVKELADIIDSDLYGKTLDENFRKRISYLFALTEKNPIFPFGERADEGVRLIRSFAKEFGESSDLVSDRYRGKFKHIVSKIDDTVEKALKKNNPILYEEYKTTNQWYATQKSFWNSRIGKALAANYQLAQPGSKSPEDLMKMLVAPNKASIIRQTRAQLGEAPFKEIRRAFLTNFFEQAGVEADKFGNVRVLHPKRVADFMRKYGSDTISAIFEDAPGTNKGDLLKRFVSLVRASKGIQRSVEAATSPERLGQVLLTGQALQNVGGAVMKTGQVVLGGGLATGKTPGGKLATVFGMLGVPYVLSKAFLGAPGMKWVTTGLLGQGTKPGNTALRGMTHLGLQTGLSTLGGAVTNE